MNNLPQSLKDTYEKVKRVLSRSCDIDLDEYTFLVLMALDNQALHDAHSTFAKEPLIQPGVTFRKFIDEDGNIHLLDKVYVAAKTEHQERMFELIEKHQLSEGSKSLSVN